MIERSKPEVLRAMDEFENACFSASKNKGDLEHPEFSTSEWKKFLKYLKALCKLVREGTILNPFKEIGPEHMTLNAGEVMDPEITRSLWEAPNIGQNRVHEDQNRDSYQAIV